LVYETHKEKLEEGYDAHHINGDEKDNFVENLKPEPHSKHIREHHKGTHHSEESKIKISESSKGKLKSKEIKQKMSEKKKGKNNPNYKISNQLIINIKIDIEKEDLTQRQIAKKHGVSQSTISRIKTIKLIF
jgi:DNA-directed RNA polymerase specialized sigma subunit